MLQKILILPLLSLFFAGLIFYSLPTFQGNFFYQKMRLQIPEEYFSLFEFFETKSKQQRIVYLPIQSLWGWNFYNWQYRGSGFLWYGIEQPIVDRAFDVWSVENETLYNELSFAFQQKDYNLLEAIIQKYDISYFIFDNSILPHNVNAHGNPYRDTKAVIDQLQLRAVWEEGELQVFETRAIKDAFVNSASGLESVHSDIVYNRYNPVTANYITDDNPLHIYPFTSLYKERLTQNITLEDGMVRLTAQLPNAGRYSVALPEFTTGDEFITHATFEYVGNTLSIIFEPAYSLQTSASTKTFARLPPITLNTQEVFDEIIVFMGRTELIIKQQQTIENVSIETNVGTALKVQVFDSQNVRKVDTQTQFLSNELINCWQRENTDEYIEKTINGDALNIKNRNVSACLPLKLGDFSNTSLLLRVSIPYQTPITENEAGICLQAESDDSYCLNEVVFYTHDERNSQPKIQDSFLLDKPDTYWISLVSQAADRTNETWEITYQDPEFYLFPVVEEYTTSTSYWDSVLSEKNSEIIAPEKTITLFSQTKTNQINLKTQYSINCDVLKRGRTNSKFDRNQLIHEADKQGSICETFLLDEQQSVEPFLLSVQGENLYGRQPKIFLSDPLSGYSYIESLSSTDKFHDWFSIIPPKEARENSRYYNLILETRSFGQPSKNSISEIKTVGFPIRQLAKIQFTSETALNEKQGELSLSDTSKIGTFLYILEVSEQKEEGLLTLSQSFDPGWIALQLSGDSQITLLDHVQYNGWANGWIVKPKTNQSTVIIIYWPQLLQFGGYFLMLTALLVLYSSRISKKSDR